MNGISIDVVRVGVTGDGDWLGSVKLDEGGEPFARLIAILLGPMAAGQDPPPWPPDPGADRGTDEREAAQAVHRGAITRAQYLAAKAIAQHLLLDHHVKGAIAAVAHKLGELGALTSVGVKDAVGPDFLNWIEAGA
jgi:hypothetical protein